MNEIALFRRAQGKRFCSDAFVYVASRPPLGDWQPIAIVVRAAVPPCIRAILVCSLKHRIRFAEGLSHLRLLVPYALKAKK